MRRVTFLLVLVTGTLACATAAAPGGRARRGISPCAVPTRDTTSLAMGRRHAGRPTALFDRVVAAYAQQGIEIAAADRARGVVMSVPHFKWPPAVPAEGQAREHPGIEVLTRLEPAGPDSTEVWWVGSVLCQVRAPGDSVPSDAQALAVKGLTLGMLAVAFEKTAAPASGTP